MLCALGLGLGWWNVKSKNFDTVIMFKVGNEIIQYHIMHVVMYDSFTEWSVLQ